MRLAAILTLTLLISGSLDAKGAHAAEPPSGPTIATDAARLTMMRKAGEACVFGAAAGAAGALLAGAPIAASGVGVSGVVSLSLGAAALGCTVGIVGATAASGFGLLWERQLEPKLVPEAGTTADYPSDLRVFWPATASFGQEE